MKKDRIKNKIVIVEDERLLIDLYRDMLTDVPRCLDIISFQEAGDFRAYISNKEFDIDIAILDMHLKGALGTDLARELLITRPCVQIVFITGYSCDAIEEFNHELIATGKYPAMIFEKPFNYKVFTDYISATLGCDCTKDKK